MTTITRRGLLAAAAGGAVALKFGTAWSASSAPWSASRANQWYAQLPWLVGCNFVPSTASNQLEMFQAATFDPDTIDRELGWATNVGMNTARIFLHNPPGEGNAGTVAPNAPLEQKLQEINLEIVNPEIHPLACVTLLVITIALMATTAEFVSRPS